MTDTSITRTQLEEIDLRQDEVIRQIDELDGRVATLLKQCLGERSGGEFTDVPG